MDQRLSKRVNEMATSATLAMAAKTRELKEQGIDIIGLSLGEPDFPIPEFVPGILPCSHLLIFRSELQQYQNPGYWRAYATPENANWRCQQ